MLGEAALTFWPHDWKPIVAAAIQSHSGDETVTSFLGRYTQIGYKEAARKLGRHIVPYMLIRLQLEEAVGSNRLRSTALELFSRLSRDYIPAGWLRSTDCTPGICEIDLAETWKECVSVFAPDLKGNVGLIADHLWNAELPVGWLPQENDPILTEAFRLHWPEA